MFFTGQCGSWCRPVHLYIHARHSNTILETSCNKGTNLAVDQSHVDAAPAFECKNKVSMMF